MSFSFNFLNKISPEKFFLFTSFFFGVFFLLTTAPFQVPDEPNHFFRAWQVSEGGLISVKQDKRVGGSLPVSLDKITAPFFSMIWTKDRKLAATGIDSLLGIPLKADERRFFDFNNTAMYSPLCYLPASVAIFLVKPFTTPLFAFYWARLAMLLFWIGLVYVSIKIMPVCKWLFAFLALLPMSLFINMSLNADVVTNAVCFLFIALILKYAFSDLSLNTRDVVLLCLVCFMLVSVKSAYAPLLILLFIIPFRKFKSIKEYFTKLSPPFLTGAVFFLFWNMLLNPLYVSYENYHQTYRDDAALINGADLHRQLQYILNNGFYIVDVIVNSFVVAFDMYFPGYIGVFGWLDIPLPKMLIYLTYITLVVVGLTDNSAKISFKAWQRIIFGVVFSLIVILVFLSQHLIWDPVGGDKIMNIQGRYLIPFMPLLFVLLYNNLMNGKKYTIPFAAITIIAVLIYSSFLVYTRYF